MDEAHAALPPLEAAARGGLAGTAAGGLHMLTRDDNLMHLLTVLHDAAAPQSDFIFYANRLIRLVVEAGLNLLSVTPSSVTTPGGAPYNGVAFGKGVCAVTIMHAGQAMEQGLRECCKSIRVGHLLVQYGPDSEHVPQIYYAKFPFDIQNRTVFLLDPVISQ